MRDINSQRVFECEKGKKGIVYTLLDTVCTASHPAILPLWCGKEGDGGGNRSKESIF